MTRRTSIRLVSVAVVTGFASCVFAAPAVGADPSGSPYATPLDALDGQTLAQYLSAHQAGNPRLGAF